ncbi:hypothetical protein [Gimesia panareensis]|uniref:hypothetical protein n=1 Tax=Gimesia panareensis TaxID=2527978 RepID=UPI001187DF34|nr:hypothetical protein [Gimesia panareensis]QDU50376.1 hypothetical protein Pan110_27220 [Gimesia panareensis]
MQKEDVAFIGCRLVGLYYAIKALETVASFVMTFVAWKSGAQFPASTAAMFYLQLMPFTFYTIAACMLWFGAGTIVKYLLPDGQIASTTSKPTLEQVQSVLFSAVGLLVLTWGITDLGKVLYQLFQLKQSSHYAQIPLTLQSECVAVACRLLLGFCLVFGSRGLSGFLTRLRQPELR